jgi:hypothetical protein
MAVQAAAERAWFAISRFYDNCKKNKPGKKGYPRFQHDNRSVEYKTSGWSLYPTKRRITFTDKKGIGELKLMGKWDIHTYPSSQLNEFGLSDVLTVSMYNSALMSFLPIKSGDGIVGFTLPKQKQPLAVGKSYQWSLVGCLWRNCTTRRSCIYG